jgi:hypothetical protein
MVNSTNIPPVPSFQIPALGQTQPMSSTAAAGYLFTPTQLVIRGYWVPHLALSITIQYTAGFRQVPSDLAHACIEMVVRKYKERTRTAERSKSMLGQSVSYEGVPITNRDITSGIQLVLDHYQAVAPITGFLTQAQTQTDPATLVAVAA